MEADTTSNRAAKPDGKRRLATAGKLAVPVVATALSLVGLKLFASSHLLRPEQLESLMRGVGVWGPLLFVLALALRPLLLLPSQLFCAVAGMLWGGVGGTAIAVAGSWLSLLVVVLLGRRLLRGPLTRWTGPRRSELEQVARRHDFLYAVVIMLNPLLPTDLCIAVAAGAGARVWRLGVGAALGVVPTAFSTAYFGSAVSRNQPLTLGVSIAAMTASLAGGAFVARGIWRSLRSASSRASSRPVRGAAPALAPLAAER